MLGMKKQQLAVRSAIGVGVRINGDCVFEGALQLDGTVLGSVTGQGNEPTALIIGESGNIEGAVSADHVVIAGSVIGPVLARELLELHAKASVRGDVRYKALEMQRGAVVAGQLQPQAALPSAVATPALPQVELVVAEQPRSKSKSKAISQPAEPTLDPDRF
jgi:cytoskeletal protein CcmA (bactofilin family)